MHYLFSGQSFHSCSWGPRAWVELIDKKTGEFILPDQCYCFLKVFPRLCREATDYVCCYGDPWHPKYMHIVK